MQVIVSDPEEIMNDNHLPAPARPIARVHGVAAIAAPLLLLVSTVAFITQGEGINHGVLGGVVGVWSCFAFVIAFTGIVRMLEPRMPRYAPVLLCLSVIGFSSGIAFNLDGIYCGAGATEVCNLAVVDGNAIVFFAFFPWGWLTPLSMVLVGAALWRARVVPWWSGALLVLGGALFVASRPERIDALAIAADIVLVVALVSIGSAILKPVRTEDRQAAQAHA